MDTSMVDPALVVRLVALVQSVPWVGPVLVWLPVLGMAAGVIDANVPVPPQGSVWVWPRRVVHVLAWSYRYARNAVPAGYVPAAQAPAGPVGPPPNVGSGVKAAAPVLLLGLLAGGLGACAAVPAGLVQDTRAVLASYQVAVGVAQAAVAANPALAATVAALVAQAAPYVAAIQAGTEPAGASPTLGALAAELLAVSAPSGGGAP